jgi:hypothetical protein
MTRVVGVGDTAGCHVCEGIYAHFRLPNGKLAHFFDKGSELQGTPKPNPNPKVRVRVARVGVRAKSMSSARLQR